MAEKPCYMIVIGELTDRARFLADYARVVPPLVRDNSAAATSSAAAAGNFSRAAGATARARWCPNGRARRRPCRFWNSPEYAQAKKLREGTGRFQVLLID